MQSALHHLLRRAWLTGVMVACLCGAVSSTQAHGEAVINAKPDALHELIELKQGVERVSLAGYAHVWVDSTDKADLTQALQQFEKFADGSVSGDADTGVHHRVEGRAYDLHQKAMWLKFSAINLHPASRWLLQVELPTTDSVTLYRQQADGRWAAESAGDMLPQSKWALRSRYPLFNLSDVTGQPVQYMVRIKHDRVPYSAAIHIYSDYELIESRQTENLFLGGYFGMSLAVALMCLTSGLTLRYANYLRYALYVTVLGFMQAAFLGLGMQYLTPEAVAWNSVSSFVVPTLSVIVALWLARALVRPWQFSKMMDAWILLLMGLLAVMMVCETFYPTYLGFRFSNSLTMVSMLSLYWMLFRSTRMGDRNARWIALGFLPVVVAGMFPVLRNFGLVSTGFLSQYAVTIGAALEVPVLLYALMQRSSSQRDMLVREQALKQQDALTGLADERMLVSKLHSSLLRARRFGHRLGLLHIRLANHELIHKEFGEKTANAALLLTANHLRSVSREIDVAARLEGDQFALLIEGPVNAARVIETATHILAQSLRPSDLLPVGTQPKLMICAALLPDDVADSMGEDANTAYQWMLSQAESDAHESPRKAIRSINF